VDDEKGSRQCQKGHYITVTPEVHGQCACECVCACVCVCLSYCCSNGRQSVNLGVGDDGHVDSLEVFIPTVTTLGLGVPYHL